MSMRLRPPSAALIGEDETVALLIRANGLWAAMPCRVAYVDEGAEGFAFAYGTREQSGHVVFRIVSFSRTVDLLARRGSPITRRLQQRVTERYLDAIAAAGAGSS